MVLHLREGEKVVHRELVQRLVAMQYTRATMWISSAALFACGAT
jgi:excinuclease UvrABC helicase subunit UvrB